MSVPDGRHERANSVSVSVVQLRVRLVPLSPARQPPSHPNPRKRRPSRVRCSPLLHCAWRCSRRSMNVGTPGGSAPPRPLRSSPARMLASTLRPRPIVRPRGATLRSQVQCPRPLKPRAAPWADQGWNGRNGASRRRRTTAGGLRPRRAVRPKSCTHIRRAACASPTRTPAGRGRIKVRRGPSRRTRCLVERRSVRCAWCVGVE